jgi:hypothetical protein
MDLHHFDQATGEYLRTEPARRNPAFGPFDPDQPEWLIPAGATTLAPPQPGAHQVAVLGAAEWYLVADWRGTVGYDAQGRAVTITALGDTLPSLGLTAEPPTLPPTVPAQITMRQARLALLQAGMLDAVDAAINALSEPAKTRARIEWEYSSSVVRANGFVAVLATALGLTDAQLDALFIAGEAR